jgi:hypothetical protein
MKVVRYIKQEGYNYIMFDFLKDKDFTIKVKKCTCGGDKAKTTHSDWCDKYIKIEKKKKGK